MLRGKWIFPQSYSAGTSSVSHILGTIGDHKVAVASVRCQNQSAAGDANLVIWDLLNTFPNIRVLVMVGIGAGMPDYESNPVQDVRLGDVVVGAASNGSDGGVCIYKEGAQGLELQRTADSVPTALRAALDRLCLR
ncbi:hypothetical protein BDW74DRAFT_175552 [Aspergillus multicolor]|uniref:uncharacterized protein n=1 Tax=Aspergillus multicolor TaxID=41759 RepID=UPI003CCDFD48